MPPPATPPAERTFRQCAQDPVGTVYHVEHYAHAEGVQTFKIVRHQDSLAALIEFPSTQAAQDAIALGPMVHGGVSFGRAGGPANLPLPVPPEISATPSRMFGWTYDKFGDVPFSALRERSYRPSPDAKMWTIWAIREECLDEVRRLCGFATLRSAVREAGPPGTAKARNVKRKLLL